MSISEYDFGVRTDPFDGGIFLECPLCPWDHMLRYDEYTVGSLGDLADEHLKECHE